MKLSLAVRSLLLFGLCVILLAALTFFETSFGVMPLMVERIVTFLGFVLPAGIGCVLGVMSLIRREGRTWLALAGIVLNGIFAVFHLLIVLYAG
jgi:hypothetical protein